MEERIARLEALLHRLLCCTPPVVGPQGPQGPMRNPGGTGNLVLCLTYMEITV